MKKHVWSHRRRSVPRRIARWFSNPRGGSSTIELAVALPMLVTVLLGAVDFGRFAYTGVAVVSAARAGAAYGSLNPVDPTKTTAWKANVLQAVKDDFSQWGLYDSTKLTVTTNFNNSSGYDRIEVTVKYPFSTIMPFSPPTMNIEEQAVMPIVR